MIKKIIALVMLLALLLTACSQTSDATTAAPDAENGQSAATEQIDTEIAEETTQNNADTGEIAGGETEPQSSEGTSESEPAQTTEGTTDTESVQTTEGTTDTEPVQTMEGTTETEPEQTTESEPEQTTQGTSEPVEVRIYEEYLAALTLFALSMEYPDFVLQGIYSGTSVSIENKMSSSGVYTMFESGGSSLIAHVYPIDAERTEPGTSDLYAAELGFAAFDLVESRDDNYSEIPQDVYTGLLSEISGVSIFSH
ncbi:MAG: hypothetical protein E7434_02395 [Ruminococcaceae bacterium]|nr:hypothetical protein [Oscillospiraceae bacterium]